MRKILLFILLFTATVPAFSQNSSNYLDLTENAPWDFFMDDVYDLENDMVINNAFTLKVRTVSNKASVYMRQ